jgi:hypothetical protein
MNAFAKVLAGWRTGATDHADQKECAGDLMLVTPTSAKPGDAVISRHGCHRHWWTASPNIPRSRISRDWWADSTDNRVSQYARLKRCWFDKTWLKGAKSDPERRHDFYNPRCGTFVLCRTWEMFTLFHPRDWVIPLCSIAEIPSVRSVSDCCWSYEFQDKKTGKLVDLTMHLRNDSGGEVLIAGEAKYGSDRLKATDHLPESYLDLDPFLGFRDRFLLYLVHDSYAGTVREQVRDEHSRHGIVTWEQTYRLALRLSDTLPNGEKILVAGWLRMMAKEHALEITTEALGTVPSVTELAESCGAVIESGQVVKQHIRDFATGFRFHLAAKSGWLPEPPFGYLSEELSCSDIHLLEDGKQTTRERCEELWRMVS